MPDWRLVDMAALLVGGLGATRGVGVQKTVSITVGIAVAGDVRVIDVVVGKLLRGGGIVSDDALRNVAGEAEGAGRRVGTGGVFGFRIARMAAKASIGRVAAGSCSSARSVRHY